MADKEVQHGYAAIDERAHTLRPEFLEETLRLWEVEKHIDSLPTVVAGVFLQMGGNSDGEVIFAPAALHHSHRMAHRLGLYESSVHSSSIELLNIEEINELKARAHTAWGLFCYITYVARCQSIGVSAFID